MRGTESSTGAVRLEKERCIYFQSAHGPNQTPIALAGEEGSESAIIIIASMFGREINLCSRR
jgi:hypothetical protein